MEKKEKVKPRKSRLLAKVQIGYSLIVLMGVSIVGYEMLKPSNWDNHLPKHNSIQAPSVSNHTPPLVGNQPNNLQHRQIVTTPRLLVDSADEQFVRDGFHVFVKVFSLVRSLMLIIAFTNTFDPFMPLLTLTQTFMMVGFFTNSKHFLGQFYKQTLNSKWDIFNLIRMGMAPAQTDAGTIPILKEYKLSNMIFFNLSGEILFMLVFLVGSILVKVLQMCLKSEKLRYLQTKIRPAWNGLIFAFLPRVCTFIGFQFRSVPQEPSLPIVFNTIFASILTLLIIFYFAFLIIQIRKLNQRVEYLYDSRDQIGLARRYRYLDNFQFDCVGFSTLYFPVMNGVRIMISFLALGAAPDLHYVQYGVIIILQCFFFLIHVSSPFYIYLRDRVLYTIAEFAILISLLLIVVIGLSESVSHSYISVKLQTIILYFLIILFPLYLITAVIDIIKMFESEDSNEYTTSRKKSYGRFSRRNKSSTRSKKLIQKSEEDEELSSEDQSVQKIKNGRVF